MTGMMVSTMAVLKRTRHDARRGRAAQKIKDYEFKIEQELRELAKTAQKAVAPIPMMTSAAVSAAMNFFRPRPRGQRG